MTAKKQLIRVCSVLLGLTLLVAIACSTGATATSPPTSATTPGAPVVSSGPTPTATPALTPAAAESVVYPGKVTLMIANFATERFDSAFSLGGHSYARIIHASLISDDVKERTYLMVPGIATEWQVSTDGLTWTLTIRKGVKFHDGSEVTVDDVLWTLRHTLGSQAPDYGTGVSITFGKIMDRIEQTGPDRVGVTLKVPSADFPEVISGAGSSSSGVYPRRATLHDLKEETAYDRNPIGAGVMKLVKHVPAAQMNFERFADYYHQPKNGFPTDKRVKFTLLDLRLIPEEATRVAALRANEADIAPVNLGARKQIEAGGGRLVFGQEGVFFNIFQLGCWKPQFPCHDKRVRQALNYAINKELIRDQLYGGTDVMQIKGWQAVTPSTIGYSPGLDPYPFDPVKARQLLVEAGYPGGKGFGKLIINTNVSPSMPLMPESAQLGAEFWKRELGLEVQVKVGDRAALQAAELTEDLHGQIWWRDNETRLDAARLVRGRYGTPDGNNRAHNDPELFGLVRQVLGVIDPVEREEVLNSAYRRLWDEAHYILLGYINIPWGVGPRILTWEPYPLAVYPSALHTITLK